MSLITWKAKFYPEPANARMSKRDALLHSLRKWEGLTKENLKKHDAEFQVMRGMVLV